MGLENNSLRLAASVNEVRKNEGSKRAEARETSEALAKGIFARMPQRRSSSPDWGGKMADKDNEKRLIQIEKSLKKLEERLAKVEKSGKKAAKGAAETAMDKIAELERAVRSSKSKSADS